jgi:hypothetical protein
VLNVAIMKGYLTWSSTMAGIIIQIQASIIGEEKLT